MQERPPKGADPAALLTAARWFEPRLRLVERSAALDALGELLSSGTDLPGSHGRNWNLELDAERAIDLARRSELDAARALAEQVINRSGPEDRLAIARATEALGRAFALVGTEGSTRRAERALLEAAERYAALDETELQGFMLVWLGNSVCFEMGDLDAAEMWSRAGLEILTPQTPRRATMLTIFSDVLIARGKWAEADQVLDEASALAASEDEPMARAYVAWSRARVASFRDDAVTTERYIREAEQDATDWFDVINTGTLFLADAAEMLDRVGEHAAADAYLARALERDPKDEAARMARAALLARRGDPDEALDALQALSRGDWFDRRLVWRFTLLAAYATLRAGRSGAGDIASRALDQATRVGGIEVATSGEPAVVAAVLPLAEAAGSRAARALLSPEGGLVVRLFGDTSVLRGDAAVELPAGQAAELVRMMASDPRGRSVETVIDILFPDVDVKVGRHRLRQLMTRLRTTAGDIVLRDGDQLRLAPAWVDIEAFRTLCDRALTASPAHVSELAYAALALWTGSPLPDDPYAEWAAAPRRQLNRRHLDLLDLLAADAARRGSLEEALRALARAREHDPYDESRYLRAAQHLIGLGRPGAARRLIGDAAEALGELCLPLPADLKAMLDSLG